MNIYNDTTQKTKKDITKKKLQLIEKAFEDETLTLGSKVVFARLLLKHYNNETGRCDPSENTLAADLKISLRQIRRFIKELRDCGWLSVHRRFNTSNLYQFNWDYDGSMRTKSVSPMRTNQVSNEDKSGNGRGQNRSFNEDKDGLLTIERTIEGTIERTHTDRVCVASPPLVKESTKQESNFPPKEESNFSPEEESTFSEKVSFPFFHQKMIPGIAVPRGQMGWVTSKNERPLRDWLVSMGLPQYSVDEMRWKAMVACFNDETNATINSLKQHHEMPGSLNNASADICGDYNGPSSGSCPEDLELIECGFSFWQTLMSGQAIVTVLRGSGRKDYEAYCVTVSASSEEIGYFCSLTLRDAEAAMPHIAALQPTRAELAMTYYQLNNRGSSFPWSQEAVLSCIRQMQKETKEMIDKRTPPNDNDDHTLFGNLAS